MWQTACACEAGRGGVESGTRASQRMNSLLSHHVQWSAEEGVSHTFQRSRRAGSCPPSAGLALSPAWNMTHWRRVLGPRCTHPYRRCGSAVWAEHVSPQRTARWNRGDCAVGTRQGRGSLWTGPTPTLHTGTTGGQEDNDAEQQHTLGTRDHPRRRTPPPPSRTKSGRRGAP